MSDNLMLDAALNYAHAGLSVIPVKKNKTPAGGVWTPYQTKIADDETLRRWFVNGSNLAIIGGPVSGGLCIIDFDEARFFNAWIESIGDLGQGLVIQKTGRDGGGYHVFFRCPDPGRSDKLAWVKDEDAAIGRRGAIEKKAGSETDGSWGYVVAAPSIHESGRQYTVIQGCLTDIPILSQARADALIAAAIKLDECPLTRQEKEREDKAIESPSYPPGGGVIGAYNSAHSIEETLHRYGYVVNGNRAHPAGCRDSITIKDGRSFHHTTADPLNDGYWKRPFSIFCILEHNGVLNRAVYSAARELNIPKPGEKPGKPIIIEQTEDEDRAPLGDSWGEPFTMRDAYKPQKDLVYVVENLLEEQTLSILYGDSGAMKSLLLADLAVCVAGGFDFLGKFKTHQSPVIWLDWDNGQPRTHNRFGAFGRCRGLPEDAPLFYYSMAEPMLDAGEPEQIKKLEKRIHDHKARLVIVDNLSLVSGEADENTRDMLNVINGFRVAAEATGCAFIIIHHQSKDTGFNKKAGDKLRGHSSIKAHIDYGFYVSRDMEREIPSSEINVFAPKQRGGDIKPFGARFEYTSKQVGLLDTARFVALEYESEKDRQKNERDAKLDEQIMNIIGDETMSINKVREKLGSRLDAIRERVIALVASGRLRTSAGARGVEYSKC